MSRRLKVSNARRTRSMFSWDIAHVVSRRQRITLNHRERKDNAMNFEEIRYEVADHVLTITLDRPERSTRSRPRWDAS